MSKIDISRVAEGLTAYAIERQNGFERYQPPGSQPWMERRRFWTDAILQGMARLKGEQPDPNLLKKYDQRLEESRSTFAAEPAPLDLQRDTIHGLQSFVYALEATGDDRRRQISAVGELLEDMACHLPWGIKGNGLDRARDEADRALVHITAQLPIRFTRVLLGWECGVCKSGYASGAVTNAEAVRKTELFEEVSQQYPDVANWPALCVVYAGRGQETAACTVDATPFDLDIMNRAGDRFLNERGVQWLGGPYQLTVSTAPVMAAMAM